MPTNIFGLAVGLSYFLVLIQFCKINLVPSMLQRVKVYRLNDDGKWDDQGTGHVTVDYIEVSFSRMFDVQFIPFCLFCQKMIHMNRLRGLIYCF